MTDSKEVQYKYRSWTLEKKPLIQIFGVVVELLLQELQVCIRFFGLSS